MTPKNKPRAPKVSRPKPKRTRKSRAADALTVHIGKLPDRRYVLRLYITGSTARSSQAIANIRSLCEEHIPGRYQLEVIDLYQQPAKASSEQIIAAPTLIKQLPLPVKRLVGDLANRDRVVVALELNGKNASWVRS